VEEGGGRKMKRKTKIKIKIKSIFKK